MNKILPLLLAAGALVAAGRASIADGYREPAQKLINAALSSDEGLHRLEFLCDRIGNRISGSASLERAIAWAADEMKRAGLENIQTPPVRVQYWVRGNESAFLLEPLRKPLAMIGLGMSVGTPAEGITGNVIVATTFEQLRALGKARVKGKIVLFNPVWKGYDETVMYRGSGASEAAKLGAKAALVRSMTGASLETPHTGALLYENGVAKIPAAAVSVEDAAMIERLVKGGNPVRVKLTMEAHQDADGNSHNVIGEIPGREKPQEIVVVGGHIDSWGIGQGANDDGSGIMAALEAVSLIKKAGLHPRRTIRLCFWVDEENGGAGSKAYRAMIGDRIRNHVAAIEMDDGAEKPVGFSVGKTGAASFERAAEIGKLLAGIDGGRMSRGEVGADIENLEADGVPAFGVRTVGIHYFDWHHTNADSFDKIVPREFKLNAASIAVLTYVLADMPERIGSLK